MPQVNAGTPEFDRVRVIGSVPRAAIPEGIPHAITFDDPPPPDSAVSDQLTVASLVRWARHRSRTPVLVLTDRDLFIPECATVFGFADRRARVAIVSTFHLRRGADDTRLVWRMRNEIAHELGHLNGLPHCTDAACVMHPASDPARLDARPIASCARCARRGARRWQRRVARAAVVALGMVLATAAGVRAVVPLLRVDVARYGPRFPEEMARMLMTLPADTAAVTARPVVLFADTRTSTAWASYRTPDPEPSARVDVRRVDGVLTASVAPTRGNAHGLANRLEAAIGRGVAREPEMNAMLSLLPAVPPSGFEVERIVAVNINKSPESVDDTLEGLFGPEARSVTRHNRRVMPERLVFASYRGPRLSIELAVGDYLNAPAAWVSWFLLRPRLRNLSASEITQDAVRGLAFTAAGTRVLVFRHGTFVIALRCRGDAARDPDLLALASTLQVF